jgi:hypothetical protein
MTTAVDDLVVREPIVSLVQDAPVLDVIVEKSKRTIVSRPIYTNIIDQPIVEIHENSNIVRDIEAEINEQQLYQNKLQEIQNLSIFLPPATSDVRRTCLASVEEEIEEGDSIIRRVKTYVVELL